VKNPAFFMEICRSWCYHAEKFQRRDFKMKKYIFVVLMAGLLIGCSNPADQKQPSTTQETAKPAAPPAAASAPAAAPETKAAVPAAETKPAETAPAPQAEAAKPAAESQAPAAAENAAKETQPAPAAETKPAETAPAPQAEAAKPAAEPQAPAAPHTSDVTSDKPVAGAGVSETVKAPAGKETPKTGQ
jgi:hypothetical protein